MTRMSAPIRSAGGWRIVRLTDRKASVTRPLPEVRDQIVGTAMSFGDRCLMKPSWVRRKLKSASFTLGISSIEISSTQGADGRRALGQDPNR